MLPTASPAAVPTRLLLALTVPLTPVVPLPHVTAPTMLVTLLITVCQLAELTTKLPFESAVTPVLPTRSKSVEPRSVHVSSVKPVEEGWGLVVRLSNPTDVEVEAVIRAGFPIARAELVRLDETPLDAPLDAAARELRLAIPPHALRSVRLEPAQP